LNYYTMILLLLSLNLNNYMIIRLLLSLNLNFYMMIRLLLSLNLNNYITIHLLLSLNLLPYNDVLTVKFFIVLLYKILLITLVVKLLCLISSEEFSMAKANYFSED